MFDIISFQVIRWFWYTAIINRVEYDNILSICNFHCSINIMIFVVNIYKCYEHIKIIRTL